MSQTSPASAWLESKAPASRSLAVQPAVPVGMWGLQKPRPVSLAPRACKGLPGPRGARHPDGQAARPTAGRAAWGMGLRPSSSRRGPWPGCVAPYGSVQKKDCLVAVCAMIQWSGSSLPRLGSPVRPVAGDTCHSGECDTSPPSRSGPSVPGAVSLSSEQTFQQLHVTTVRVTPRSVAFMTAGSRAALDALTATPWAMFSSCPHFANEERRFGAGKLLALVQCVCGAGISPSRSCLYPRTYSVRSIRATRTRTRCDRITRGWCAGGKE